MTKLQLRIYTNPGEAQIFINLQRKDGALETVTAILDTGAAISLFPIELLSMIVNRPSIN